ncbi:MAG TPA: tetratricopeptide repeat protein [bacterium]|jgi:tetratricopeptide (TPR) repeat protein|nr:tetratricopeptide repeat protein [bacterium]
MQANYDDDVVFLESRLKDNPKSILFARLADIYLKSDQTDKAIALLERGLSYHPNYASAHFILAKCFFKSDEFDKTEQKLKKVLSIEPRFLTAHKLYGDLLAKQGWRKSSEKCFSQLAAIDPSLASLAPAPAKIEPHESPAERFFESDVAKKEPEFEVPPLPKTPVEKLTEEISPLDIPAPAETDTLEFGERQPEDKSTGVLELDIDDFNLVDSENTTDDDQHLVDDIKTAQDIDYHGDEFEDAEERFSNILDDIFSPQIREEEEERSRAALERLDSSRFFDEKDDTTAQSSPAETILSRQPAPASAQRMDTVKTADSTPPPNRMQPNVDETLDLDREFVQRAARREDDDDLLSFDSYLSGMEEETVESPDLESAMPQLDQDLTEAEPALEPLQVEDELGELDNLVTKTDAPEDEPLSDIFNALQETDEIVTAADRSPAESSPRSTFIEEELQRNAAPISESESKDRTKEKFVTPTLGEIYAAQGQYEKAIDVFEMLSKRHPENEWYQTKLQHLRKRLQEENEH